MTYDVIRDVDLVYSETLFYASYDREYGDLDYHFTVDGKHLPILQRIAILYRFFRYVSKSR